jgi:hypothetical protein
MAQSIWYLKHADEVFGPFPGPQIEEALQAGEVSPDWEVSLNGIDWLSIADSGQFESSKTPGSPGETSDTVAWHEQRLEARKRWLHDAGGVTDLARDPLQDAAVRSSVERDHIRTQVLLQEEKNKRASPWIALLGLALVAGIGVTIWMGQGDKPIQTGIGQSVDCAAALTERVNWQGCDKPGYQHHHAQARNARLDRAKLPDARLKGSDLAYASLTGASLRNAELVDVDLTGADLTNADLTGADLSGADLSFAVLTGADLTGARFSASKLDKATWIDSRICATGSMDICR